MKVETMAEQLLFTTVHIETGDSGTGTAFFFTYSVGDLRYPFLVTNKHVIRGAQKAAITFQTGENNELRLGKPYRLQFTEFEQLWCQHVDPNIDVAVVPVGPMLQHLEREGVKPFFRPIDRSLTISESSLAEVDALEEVVFIGYPGPIWDTTNFLPVIRKGITATPLSVDYEGRKQFLVDGSVFPGSSGSPVFLFNKGIYGARSGGAVVGNRLLFLGVIASVYFQPGVNEIRVLPKQESSGVPVAISKNLINLGIVFKAAAVVEAIESCLTARGVSLATSAGSPNVAAPGK